MWRRRRTGRFHPGTADQHRARDSDPGPDHPRAGRPRPGHRGGGGGAQHDDQAPAQHRLQGREELDGGDVGGEDAGGARAQTSVGLRGVRDTEDDRRGDRGGGMSGTRRPERESAPQRVVRRVVE